MLVHIVQSVQIPKTWTGTIPKKSFLVLYSGSSTVYFDWFIGVPTLNARGQFSKSRYKKVCANTIGQYTGDCGKIRAGAVNGYLRRNNTPIRFLCDKTPAFPEFDDRGWPEERHCR